MADQFWIQKPLYEDYNGYQFVYGKSFFVFLWNIQLI